MIVFCAEANKIDSEVTIMSVIVSHSYTLSGEKGVNLLPLCDVHLPLLYRWNSDMEVLYWCEGDDIVEPYDQETVDSIYGIVSKDAYCFLITVNSTPIGDCWVQKMNIPDILNQYPAEMQIARIDYCIGDKTFWGKGIGTECVRLLMDFSFRTLEYDVIYALVYDYNVRSIRLIEHAGFTLEKEKPITQSQKAKSERIYRVTKEDYCRV